jgi:hypothetical protein
MDLSYGPGYERFREEVRALREHAAKAPKAEPKSRRRPTRRCLRRC